MKKKITVMMFACAVVLMSLSGCGKGSNNAPDNAENNAENNATYASGVYTGQSSADDRGAFGEVTITIEDNAITDCQYVTFQEDGTPKDENYGKVDGQITDQEMYDKAQVAVTAMEKYAQQLVEVQKPEDVDGIAGATTTYTQFNEAVSIALGEAAK